MCESEFPLWALLPKKETGVASFLNKYPEYDGRGIKIVIFDSGIDPGAAGLQKTSHGLPKIIDMVDATGAGDVDTSAVIEAENGQIMGLSGRKLNIPPSWNNPTGKFHVGIKNAYELYPALLRERVQRKRKEKEWDPEQKTAQAQALRRLQEFDDKHPHSNQLNADEKLEREDLEAQVDVLASLEKQYVDYGPALDCVVFHDGTAWKAVLDTSGTGDLESCTLLEPFRETHRFATLSKEDMLNYVVNVHNDGNLLEIVSMSSAHGTHVASIASAYFPDEPEKNGIAPGAQIVSICIGDSRLGSMETGTALVRAVIKVAEIGCDVINMSYGEHSHWTGGRVMELLHEVVDKHGALMVVSASNHGPALFTVGTPPTMKSSSVLGIGAYVSPDMMIAEYSLLEKMPGMGYTWTSRGPTMDGDFGVCVCAPGGAVTSVPNWTLRSAQLMNGTSMSSPHVAGAMGIILSGLKARGVSYSPYAIRRAIQNTALRVPMWDPFSMGHGLLQVEKAFDTLLETAHCVERDVRFNVTCNRVSRGVCLREPHLMFRPRVFTVEVTPEFKDKTDPQRKIDFELHLNLACDVAWVSAPAHLTLPYSERSFAVKVDPVGLSHGAHFTTVRAYDSRNPDKGPVFEVPITVIKPQRTSDPVSYEYWVNGLMLKPGCINREFLEVPLGSTWAVVRVRSCDSQKTGHVVLHAIQLERHCSMKTHEFYKSSQLGVLEELCYSFPVMENGTLEVALAKLWSSIGEMVVNFCVSFHGLKVNESTIVMHPAEGIRRVNVVSTLRAEEVAPVVSLKHHILPLRPTEFKIRPLGARDIIPDGRQVYELNLTYAFAVSNKNTEILPSCPYLCEFLYESEFESQLWMLFDSNKRLIGSGDAYPQKYTQKVEKGDYTLKMHVRHEQKALLEKLSDLLMVVKIKLTAPVSLDLYASCAQALIAGKKFPPSTIVERSASCPVFVAPLASDKMPKGCLPGHYLLGTMTFAKDELGKKADIYQFKYIVSELPKKTPLPKATEKSPEDEFTEALRDLKVSALSKQQGKASDELFDELEAKHPLHYPTSVARLQSLDSSKDRKDNLDAIVKTSEKILELVNPTEVLAAIAAKNSKKDSVASKALDKQKAAIIEALTKKGAALCDLMEIGPSGDGAPSMADVDAVYSDLLKWVDAGDSKVSSFTEKHSNVHGHHGRLLKYLLKLLEEKPTVELERNCIAVYGKVQWNHCVRHFERSLPVRYPSNYRLF